MDTIRILIVEDDQNKLDRLDEFVRSKFASCLIEKRLSYQSGLKEILANRHHVVILDMTMPTYDKSPRDSGWKVRAFAGQEILKKMKRKAITMPVVVVTQFESFPTDSGSMSLVELRKSLLDEYAGIFVDAIFYNAAIDNWREELGSVLDRLMPGRD